MKPESIFSRSQTPSTCACCEPHECWPHTTTLSVQDAFSVQLPFTCSSSERFIILHFFSHLYSTRHNPCQCYPPSLDIIIELFVEQHKSWSSSLCSVLQLLSHLSFWHTSCSIFSGTISHCFSLNVADQVLHSHKLYLQYILIFTFLGNRFEYRRFWNEWSHFNSFAFVIMIFYCCLQTLELCDTCVAISGRRLGS